MAAAPQRWRPAPRDGRRASVRPGEGEGPGRGGRRARRARRAAEGARARALQPEISRTDLMCPPPLPMTVPAWMFVIHMRIVIVSPGAAALSAPTANGSARMSEQERVCKGAGAWVMEQGGPRSLDGCARAHGGASVRAGRLARRRGRQAVRGQVLRSAGVRAPCALHRGGKAHDSDSGPTAGSSPSCPAPARR